LLTWLMTNAESLYTMRRLKPSSTAIRSPWRHASYSVVLLEAGKCTRRTYRSLSLVGVMNRMPALAPLMLRVPSKYITQCLGQVAAMGSWISVHSAMKLAKTCDLTDDQLLNSMEYLSSSTTHLMMRPLASLLRRISSSGNSETTVIL